MLIGLVGAPGSGKTVLGAKLYAELLEMGINSCGYVSEFAKEWLGKGREIRFLKDQKALTVGQLRKEEEALLCNFNPTICDSALWLGPVYAEYKFNTNQYNDLFEKVSEIDIAKYWDVVSTCSYDKIIFTPLFDRTHSKVDQFRIHDVEQSKLIENYIETYLDRYAKEVILAPVNLKKRNKFIKELANGISVQFKQNN